jgi:peptide deformylase
MAVRDIVLYAENRMILRRRSRPVRVVNQPVIRLIRDLKDTLNHHSNGVGLAAPQIGVHRRVVVVRLGGRRENEGEPGTPVALINPEIIASSDERMDFDGCLSFPGLYARTTRPHCLRVTSLDEEGNPYDRAFEDFDAVVVHHEIDHLNGVLFIDRVKDVKDLYRVRTDESGEFVREAILLGEHSVPERDGDL